MRFYQLGEVPNGLYQDETAIGYNAYSILTTGKDEYGRAFPIYFKSFGDWKHPVYIYLTTISVDIFGLTPFAVRFPSALFGFLSVIIFYFFVKKLTSNDNLSLVSTLLFAINPWSIHYNRAAFEVSVSLFLFLLGGLLLICSFDRKKSLFFTLGVVMFVINIYTYNLTRLLSPILLLVFLLYYKNKLSKLPKTGYIITAVVSLILLIPFLSTFFSGGGVSSASGTLIFSSAAVKAPILEFRSYLIGLPAIFSKVFFNTDVSIFWKYINNVASYFSIPFFFISGSTHGNHGIGNVGQFYLFELPLIITGIIFAFKEKKEWVKLLVFWIIAVIMVASLTRETPHATRSFFLIFPLIIFSGAGAIFLFDYFKKRKTIGKIILGIFVAFCFYNITYYFTSYYVRFPVSYAKAWREEDKNLSLFIKGVEKDYDKIIFDKKAGFIYSSLLFYDRYDPKTFQDSVLRNPDDSEGFSEVKSFGKYEFKEIDWAKDLKEGVLIVTTAGNKPDEARELVKFTYPQRPIVISDKEKILEFPVTEDAYVIIESR